MSPRAAEVKRLAVAAAVRRRGVASLLMQTAETFARSLLASGKSRFYDSITATTINGMEAAVALYRSRGYTEDESGTASATAVALRCFTLEFEASVVVA